MRKSNSVLAIATCEEEKSLKERVEITFKAGVISISTALISVAVIIIMEFGEILTPAINKFGITETIEKFSRCSQFLLLICVLSLFVNLACFLYLFHIYKKEH